MIARPAIQKDASLKPYNTFGFDYPAAALIPFHDPAELAAIAEDLSLPRPFHVLGGGSNVLLTGAVKGTVLLNRIPGIELIEEDEDSVVLRVGAGEVWHHFVEHVIAQGWGGVENLSLIPGTVGAAPIQNIGAYGVEVKDVIHSVEAWHWEQRNFIRIAAADCHFGYRDSIFKAALKDKAVVTRVNFRLSKKPVLHTEYGAIRDELQAMDVPASLANVAAAVVRIRRSKLPDPAQIGNAGSFFKNPVVPAALFEELRQRFPEMPSYTSPDGGRKLPAGWLIEHCGWKGFREGDAGVHARQALVLVNYGKAAGSDIKKLSERIMDSVAQEFGISLEREVQMW